MSNKLYEEKSIQAIADAIRVKNGGTDTYTVSQMSDQILSLPMGNIPSYHFVESARVAKNIIAFKEDHPNNLVFGVVTDAHVYNADEIYETDTKKSIRHSAFALETVGAMVGCDFIVNLGDNCWENGIDTDNSLLGAQYAIDALKPAFVRLTRYNLVGNHDKSSNTQMLYDLIGSYNEFDDYGITQIRGFGYKDYVDKKIRVIVLNTCDYLNANGGCALSYEQKDFLMRALDLSTKTDYADWQILLLSHIPLDWNGGDYDFYADLQTILKSYENGTIASIAVNSSYALNETPSDYTTYSDGFLVYDYNSKNSAKIIANIHGHVHTNKVSKLANSNILRMATPNSCFYLNKTESYTENGDYSITEIEASKLVKIQDTAKDTSVTFYCIDLDKAIIHAYAYGAGVDRIATYSDDETIFYITYNLDNAQSNNTAIFCTEGESYTTSLFPLEDYEITDVVITMDGEDITSSVYSNGEITIENVTGDIVITVTTKDVYVPYWDVANRTATTDLYAISSEDKEFSRHNYYYGVSGTGLINYSKISNVSVNNNDITFQSSEKNYGIGVPYHLEAGAEYTFSAKASVAGRLRKIFYDANGVFVSGSETYSSSGTDLTLTFAAPTDTTQWVMLILDAYAADQPVTYSDIALVKIDGGSNNQTEYIDVGYGYSSSVPINSSDYARINMIAGETRSTNYAPVTPIKICEIRSTSGDLITIPETVLDLPSYGYGCPASSDTESEYFNYIEFKDGGSVAYHQLVEAVDMKNITFENKGSGLFFGAHSSRCVNNIPCYHFVWSTSTEGEEIVNSEEDGLISVTSEGVWIKDSNIEDLDSLAKTISSVPYCMVCYVIDETITDISDLLQSDGYIDVSPEGTIYFKNIYDGDEMTTQPVHYKVTYFLQGTES